RTAAEDAVGASQPARVRAVDDDAAGVGIVERGGFGGDDGFVRCRRASRGAPIGQRGAWRGGGSGAGTDRPRARSRRIQHHAGRRAGHLGSGDRQFPDADEVRGGQVRQPAHVRERAGICGTAWCGDPASDEWRLDVQRELRAADRVAGTETERPAVENAADDWWLYYPRVEVLAAW